MSHEHDHDEHQGGGYFRGLLTGVLFGAAAALMFAPKRGEEMRGELRGRVDDLRGRAEELQGRVTEAASEIKERGTHLVESAKERSTAVIEHAKQEAVELKSEAAQEVQGVKETIVPQQDEAATSSEEANAEQEHDVVNSV
jgi:gas vesicle protein